MPNLRRALLSLVLLPLFLIAAPPTHAKVLPVQGGPGGGSFSSDCGNDYVVGMYVKSGSWIDAIGLKCSSFGAGNKYKQPAINRPYFGGSGGGEQTGLCPATSYVSGIMFGFTRDGNNPKYVDNVQLTCTNLANGAQTRVCLQTGEGCQIGRAGAPSGPGGLAGTPTIPAAIQNCPAGEAVKGIHGRHGSYVDALGLVCGAKPQLVAAPAPPPPPCPEGQMRLQGKCQVPPVLPGSSTGTGGGFIQMFPTCADGKTYDASAKACVAKATTPPPPPPPPANTCSVEKPGAVYDKPGGNGRKIGELATGTQGVVLLQKDGANWFRVKWAGGEGWVYSGPGYANALKC